MVNDEHIVISKGDHLTDGEVRVSDSRCRRSRIVGKVPMSLSQFGTCRHELAAHGCRTVG